MTKPVSLKQFFWAFRAPTILFLAHTVADFGLGVYTFWPWFDIPAHILGGVTIAMLVKELYLLFLHSGHVPILKRFAFVALGTSIVVMVAVWWEFAEFIIDQFFGTSFQPSLADTMLDLLLGMSGGAVALMLLYRK